MDMEMHIKLSMMKGIANANNQVKLVKQPIKMSYLIKRPIKAKEY